MLDANFIYEVLFAKKAWSFDSLIDHLNCMMNFFDIGSFSRDDVKTYIQTLVESGLVLLCSGESDEEFACNRRHVEKDYSKANLSL